LTHCHFLKIVVWGLAGSGGLDACWNFGTSGPTPATTNGLSFSEKLGTGIGLASLVVAIIGILIGLRYRRKKKEEKEKETETEKEGDKDKDKNSVSHGE
jgi:H+/gluconate symporter-like permease